MTATDIRSVARIERSEAPGLAAEEYQRLAALAAELSPDDWSRPTPDCPEWTVRDVLAHVAGSMAGTSLREGARQRKLAGHRSKSSGRTFLDEMNELHIEDRARRNDAEIAIELQDRIRSAVNARRRVPGPLRRAPIPNTDGLTLAQVVDVILTRDVWMHRVDVCRATDRQPELTAEHDGRLVADVVRDWADRHGQPFTLRLSGTAGGMFMRAGAGPDLDLDAVEFCRILSGRLPGRGLLATQVVF
ncbi:MAG TPA: maleylpyruvate isomerase family mycothiol-dependent enzyme [Acidimicrobiales bacterium]|nr:maleylpyruvate isomerase family mycothiol-dependent enzyme [Acidimicrobiales bacterium]